MAKCGYKTFYIDQPSNVKKGFVCDQTLQLECNKTYPFVMLPSCQNNCVATITADLINNAGTTLQTQTNVTITNPFNVIFNTVGNNQYTIIFHLLVNGLECDKCLVNIKVDCPPPTCNTCVTKLTNLKQDTLVPYQGITSLVEAFTFANLPANIIQVKATVTNFIFTYVDANNKINDECATCNTNVTSWASVFGGDKIDGIKPTVNINNVETNSPVTLPQMVPNKNPRQATWSNNGAILNVPSIIKVGFILPAKSTLTCCTAKANICLKFVFKNDKCEECIVYKCFDVDINK